MTIQEKFAEVKDHPLVVLLLKYYAKNAKHPIPAIWQSFIKDSTPDTNLDLMYLQLPAWRLLPDQIPEGLRGPELLNHILNLKIQPVLDIVSQTMTNKKLGFIPALEQVFRANKIIPSCVAANNPSSNFGVGMFPAAYEYVETGTLKYRITRTVPANLCIPASFIRAFCKPEYSDDQVWRNFIAGMDTKFKSPQETSVTNASFEWLWKLFRSPKEYALSPTTLTRAISSVSFPAVFNVCCSNDERVEQMILSNPVPDKTNSSSVRFRFPKTPEGRPARTNLYFPAVFNDADLQDLSTAGIRPEPAVPVFTGNIGGYLQNPDDPDYVEMRSNFVAALRQAYERITESETFQAQRNAAIEAAAGV